MNENIHPVKRGEFTEGVIKERVKDLRKAITHSMRELMLIKLPQLGGNARRDVWNCLIQRHIDAMGLPDKDVGLLSVTPLSPEHKTVCACIIDSIVDVVFLFWDYREKTADPDMPASWLTVETKIRKHLATWKLWHEHCTELKVAGSVRDGWELFITADEDPFEKEEADGTPETTTEEGTPDIVSLSDGKGSTLGRDIGVGDRAKHVFPAKNPPCLGGSTIPDNDGDD